MRSNAADIDAVARQSLQLEEITGPPVSKAYEDSFLIEASEADGERPCVAGRNGTCQGVLMAARTTFQSVEGRPMKEFLLPSQASLFAATGKLPAVHGFCVLCTRYLCTEALTRRGILHTGKFRGNLCPYSVKVDSEGECELQKKKPPPTKKKRDCPPLQPRERPPQPPAAVCRAPSGTLSRRRRRRLAEVPLDE